MRIFITGVGGYIGGSVAARLLAEGRAIAGLTRSAETAARLREQGIEPVLGALDDSELLAAQAARADAVVNAADSDHPSSAQVLIAALAGTGKTLLHSSGISVVARDDQGQPGARIHRDTDGPPLDPVPQKAGRVAIDRAVLAASARGVASAVLCNSLIYGEGLGLSRNSIQLPMLAAVARRHAAPRHIGPGLNLWSTVHVADMADLYVLALDAGAAGRLGPEAFFYVEDGEVSFRDLTAALGRGLGLAGPPRPWPIEEAIAELGETRARFTLGSNCRVRGVRARDVLGWQPRREPVLDWIGRAYSQRDGAAHL